MGLRHSAAFDGGIFPDNMLAAKVFEVLDTQWRTGMGGLHGLEYGTIPSVLRLLDVGRKEWKRLFADLRTMERAVLEMLQSS